MRDEEFIIGIKDSSGRETKLARFAAAREGLDWTLLVGDDRLLALGLQAGWDGGISGLACCCPELLVAIIRSARAGDAAETSRLLLLLESSSRRLGACPRRGAFAIALEGRGLADRSAPSAAFSVTAREQIDRVRAWFRDWHREQFGGTSSRGRLSVKSVAPWHQFSSTALLAVCRLDGAAQGEKPFLTSELIFPLEHWHNHGSAVVNLRMVTC